MLHGLELGIDRTRLTQSRYERLCVRDRLGLSEQEDDLGALTGLERDRAHESAAVVMEAAGESAEVCIAHRFGGGGGAVASDELGATGGVGSAVDVGGYERRAPREVQVEPAARHQRRGGLVPPGHHPLLCGTPRIAKAPLHEMGDREVARAFSDVGETESCDADGFGVCDEPVQRMSDAVGRMLEA